MNDLRIEDLPGEQARLLHHLMPILRIGVAVKIQTLVQEAFTARVHQHAERVVVLLEPVTDGEVAVRRRVHIPLHGVRTRPVAGDRGADVDRHAMADTGVVFRATHLREVPVRPEIARAHLGIRFEPAARHHHGAGAQVVLSKAVADPHALDARIAVQQRCGGGVVQHRYADALQPLVQRGDEMLAAAKDVACKAAPELEFPVHLECLPTERRLKPHALSAQPKTSIEAVADQHLGEIGVAAILGQPPHVVEILAFGVAAEVDAAEVEVGDVGCKAQQVIDLGIGEAERTAGERRVAAARLSWRRLDHGDGGTCLLRRQRRVPRRIAGADHQDVNVTQFRRCHAPPPEFSAAILARCLTSHQDVEC